MKNIRSKSKIAWRNEGEAPDYRFSLANERTYLAWIRTALALLAGAVAIDQLSPELANPVIRAGLSLFLCLSSGMLSLFAYRRWAANEKSMRNNKALNYTDFFETYQYRYAYSDIAHNFRDRVMIRDKGLQPERTAMSWLRTQLVLFGTSLLLSRTYFVHHNKLLALTTLFCIILAFIFSIYIQRRFEKGFTNLNAISSLEYKAKVLLSITVALLAFCYALFNFFRLWWKF